MIVVHNWMPCPVYSGEEFFMEAKEQGNNEMFIFQTGLTGSTGCIILMSFMGANS